LHIDDKVGSIKVGKDADVVLWSTNPLSIYAQAEKTVIEGTVYYDAKKDEAKRVVSQERNLIIGQMLEEKQRNEHGNRRRKLR
jgi:urease alpha subunit